MGRWPLVDIGRQRERRESGQWNLSIGFELTSAFVNRGYAAWKNVADGGPFSFSAKSGEERSGLSNGPLLFRRFAHVYKRVPRIPSPLHLRFCAPAKLSHFPNRPLTLSHFSSNLSIFFFIAHTLIFSLKIYKYIYIKRVNESSNHFSRIDGQRRQCRGYRFFLIYDESRGGRGEKNLDRIWLSSWIRSFADGVPFGHLPRTYRWQ